MAYDFDYAPLIDQLQSLMATAWALPQLNPIVEVGQVYSEEPISTNLPMAMLELDGGVSISENDPQATGSVKVLTHTLIYHCWLLRAAETDTRALREMRILLKTFAQSIMADRRLNGTATFSWLTGMDWSGTGRPWPVDIETGAGVHAGYVTVKCVIDDA
jgi:hypothetical protein